MKLSAGMEMVGRGWLARRSNEIVSKPVRQAPNFPPSDSLEDARAFKRQKVVNSVIPFDIPLCPTLDATGQFELKSLSKLTGI
jgi:hypothetical protein